MNRSKQEIQQIISGFRHAQISAYPELQRCNTSDLYKDFFGGGGLYLAVKMLRTLRLQAGQVVLDLGCGKGETSIFLAKRYGVLVKALDLWTSAEYLSQKFAACGVSDRVTAFQMDATQPLPFAENEFDTIFCMNSFNFYGANPGFLEHLLKHLKPGGQLCIGSEALSVEFTAEQLANPPAVYAFKLPPPNDHVDVFADDFSRQHSPIWWKNFLQDSGLLEVEICEELDDADVLYEELVRYEFENNTDPFDVQICLNQMDWGRDHQPKKTLFVLTAQKR